MEKRNVDGGVVLGNLFFTSGHCVEAETLEAEIRKIMEMLKERIARQGATMKDVVKATVFLRDLYDRERTLNPIWKEYFPENPPARTCVEAGIGRCRVEIEMIVALPAK
jgi:enamine deaminase RidA (YjgF/YER057c/UK114 family)